MRSKQLYSGKYYNLCTKVKTKLKLINDLYTGVTINKWAIACFASQHVCSDTLIKTFVSRLKQISGVAGMPIINGPSTIMYAHGKEQVEPLLRLNSLFMG